MSKNISAKRPGDGYTIAYHGWMDSSLSDSEKITLIRIYSLYNVNTRTWYLQPTVANLAEMRGMHKETIRQHFDAIEMAGWIIRKRSALIGGGSVVTLEIVRPERGKVEFSKAVQTPPSEDSPNAGLTKTVQTPSSINRVNNKDKNNKNSDDDSSYLESKPAGSGQEQQHQHQHHFDSALPPARGNTKPIPSGSGVKRKLTPEVAGLAAELLGPWGDEAKLIEALTQEQLERPEFISECIREVLGRVRNLKLSGRPTGYLLKVLKSEWKDGAWRPEAEVEAEVESARKQKADERRKKRWS